MSVQIMSDHVQSRSCPFFHCKQKNGHDRAIDSPCLTCSEFFDVTNRPVADLASLLSLYDSLYANMPMYLY